MTNNIATTYSSGCTDRNLPRASARTTQLMNPTPIPLAIE
ncbi:Uncharacterised protein [Mycobacteroides abscessus subsp. abscessus]|nr:Uncharacterised protein [Mycobacteroides abscessus subsp. abscessus]